MADTVTQPLWMRILMYLIPGIFVLFGALAFLDSWRFVRNAQPAEAEILSVRYVYKSRTDTTTKRTVENGDYYPTVRYQDAAGGWWQAETHLPVFFEPEAGQTFEILYHEENRGWVQERHGFFTTWMVPLIMFGLGIAGALGIRLVLQSMSRADAKRRAAERGSG
ncbi:DUF3592 domain-containing protein [Leisingera sp. McT4-56]|uniref:DUF3592 domain-containing protein n=1 Tax=Leisingera sp. McT4-56 TaxID=2881255 RepID=UPI001CF81975|nr:DUF3592 domain-containing protein [Leisingera sp. McT4-56]MCB4454973.1 DUF3592 domain-containing protein [Leisingera sp. McT4-56]